MNRILPIPEALEGAAELLDPSQRARLDAQMEAMYGVGGNPHDPLQDAKSAGWHEVLYRDIPTLREAELSLAGCYVRLYDPRTGAATACAATKVSKWVNQGYLPALDLEVNEDSYVA